MGQFRHVGGRGSQDTKFSLGHTPQLIACVVLRGNRQLPTPLLQQFLEKHEGGGSTCLLFIINIRVEKVLTVKETPLRLICLGWLESSLKRLALCGGGLMFL